MFNLSVDKEKPLLFVGEEEVNIFKMAFYIYLVAHQKS